MILRSSGYCQSVVHQANSCLMPRLARMTIRSGTYLRVVAFPKTLSSLSHSNGVFTELSTKLVSPSHLNYHCAITDRLPLLALDNIWCASGGS